MKIKPESVSRTISILDTTLRDGDQAPGCAFTAAQKLHIARLLDQAGVDIIEAGFPSSSAVDFAACSSIAAEHLSARIAVMCRALPKEIMHAASVFQSALPEKTMLHITLPVSRSHIEQKLGKTHAAVLSAASECVSFARNYAPYVEMGAEDAFRSDRSFLAEYCIAAAEAGASVVNIADTVGSADPHSVTSLIRFLLKKVPHFADGRSRISIHCHNDAGLASANTIAALEAGCAQAEVTASGIGERSGNASLEELYALLCQRGRKMTAGILNHNLEKIIDVNRYLFTILGTDSPPFRPVTGRNVNVHASGIHQKAVLLDPHLYGMRNAFTHIVISRHSGSAGLVRAVEQCTGIVLDQMQTDQVMSDIKNSADSISVFGATDLQRILFRRGIIAAAPTECLYIEEKTTVSEIRLFITINQPLHVTIGRYLPDVQLNAVQQRAVQPVCIEAAGANLAQAACEFYSRAGGDSLRVMTISFSSFSDGSFHQKETSRLFFEGEVTGKDGVPRRYSIEKSGPVMQSKLLIDCLLDILNGEKAVRTARQSACQTHCSF